jgi:hypothetical protein
MFRLGQQPIEWNDSPPVYVSNEELYSWIPGNENNGGLPTDFGAPAVGDGSDFGNQYVEGQDSSFGPDANYEDDWGSPGGKTIFPPELLQ